MINITYRTCQETIKMKDIFNNLKIQNKENAVYHPPFNLKTNTPDGYKNIKTLYRTEKQISVTCYFKNNTTLKCSNHHRLMTINGWKEVKDITNDDMISTKTGITYLKHIKINKEEILYDISVEHVQCYYSNNILSHNSWFLVNIGADAIKRGLNVVHYTLELNEGYVGKRYDALLTGINSQSLKYNQADVKEAVGNITGDLTIKYYPTKSITLSTIRSHLEKLISLDKKPDVVIVDYADLIRSTQTRKEVRHELESIYEELRGMAGEYELPIYTASQAGRSSAEDDIIEGNRISESYAKLMIADFVISLSRKLNDKLTGTGRWYIIKNRFGVDGLTLMSKLNLSTGHIEIYDAETIDGKQTKKIMSQDNIKKVLAEKYLDITGHNINDTSMPF